MLKPVFNMLHLTDLHFTDSESTQESAHVHRELVLRDLVTRFEELVYLPDRNRDQPWSKDAPNWKPDIIAISGDIAYRGSWGEYVKAREFLEKLARKCNTPEIIACPGNHDRNGTYMSGLVYPSSAAEADEWLSTEQLQPDKAAAQGGAAKRDASFSRSPLVVPFQNYQQFCSEAKFLKPAIVPGLDYLVGTVESKKAPVEFVVINSAWFCNYRSKLDARNLWLGLPLLQKIEVDRLNRLEEERQSGRASSGRTPERLRVALVHHPKEWLHEGECNSYGDRPNAFRLLAQSCDVILSGHVHGSVEPPSQAYNAALLFTGGATYEGARWRNNFSLLQFDLEEGVVTRRAFEFDPREMRWLEASYGSANQELTRRKSPYRQNGEAPVSQVRNVVTNPNELVGKWRSVYWNEGRTDGRRYKNTVEFSVQVQTVTGNVIPDDDDANASVENAFVLKGTFEAGYLTGTWRSEHPDETKKRWGSLQVQVFRDDEDDESRQPERKSKKADHAPVLRMKGRWIGFDRNGQVKVGQWRFKKLPT